MAPVPASLDISFTSNYPVGVHRVCYRIAGSGSPYTCIPVTCTPYTPPALPPTCSVSIPITVDNESCDPVTYEGYVQASCEAESSTAGRTPFTITFTPTPTCKGVEYICNDVGIYLITVTDGGTGYNPASPPNAVASGGGGTAVLSVTVDGSGVVTAVTVISSGNYSSTPIITIDPSPTPGGKQATAEATLAKCPEFNLGTNCDGSPKGLVYTVFAGTSFTTCYTGGLAGAPVSFPTEYTRVASTDCCYACKIYTVTSIDDTQKLTFSDCTDSGNTKTITISSGVPPTIICAVEGSVFTTGNATIVVGADC